METPWFQVFIIFNLVVTIDSLPFQDFIVLIHDNLIWKMNKKNWV
jgi:hypothetical protein